MRIYVKRENWDGGLWLELPATASDAKRLWQELKEIHPSAMLPFVRADSRIEGMGKAWPASWSLRKGTW